MVVVRADPPSFPLTCVLSNNSQKIKKETFTVSSVFGFTLVQLTLFLKVGLVMSPPLLRPHLLPSQKAPSRFSSGNIARFVVSASLPLAWPLELTTFLRLHQLLVASVPKVGNGSGFSVKIPDTT